MPVSSQKKVMSLRLSDEERARLEALAEERDLGLSDVLREGLRLVVEEDREIESEGRRRALAT